MRKSKKAPQIITLETDIKPVLSPSAQIGTLCAEGNSPGLDLADLTDKIGRMKERHRDLWVFATLQLEGALRVQELLNVHPNDIDAMGRLRIKGLKGSLDRVVSSGEAKSDVEYYRAAGFVPWAKWNRFYLYREYKKAGIVLEVNGNLKKSVTHALRHASARVVNEDQNNTGMATTLLGHVSTSSTEHYVQEASASVRAKKGRTRKS